MCRLHSNALYLLVFVSQRLLFAVESGGTLSYLDETLKKALLHIRRLFDKFIVHLVVVLSMLPLLSLLLFRMKKRDKFKILRCQKGTDVASYLASDFLKSLLSGLNGLSWGLIVEQSWIKLT